MPTIDVESMALSSVPVKDIEIPPGRREIDQKVVTTLAESIEQIGLLHPIKVRFVPPPPMGKKDTIANSSPRYILSAGAHRLAAFKKLGKRTIPCVLIQGDERDARLAEISENLHRHELTVLERSELEAEWIEIMRQKKVAQNVPPSGGVQPKDQGIREAARTLPVKGETEGAKKENLRRSKQIASLPEPAKQAARDAGLDNSQSVLLTAAAEADKVRKTSGEEAATRAAQEQISKAAKAKEEKKAAREAKKTAEAQRMIEAPLPEEMHSEAWQFGYMLAERTPKSENSVMLTYIAEFVTKEHKKEVEAGFRAYMKERWMI